MATANEHTDFNPVKTNLEHLYIPNGEVMDEQEVMRRRKIVEKAFLTIRPAEILAMLPLIVVMWVGFGHYVALQEIVGLKVTALSQKVFWGMYITNFVFWIGVSHVGMLISAVMRILNAKFRTPITRLAEEVTIVSLLMGAGSVLIDMGRLDRALHIAWYANMTSPLVWDVISISFYLTGSLIFFYTPIIPDFAYYRDNLNPKVHGMRIKIYKILALNWRGTQEQYEIIEDKIMSRLKWFILPIAVSVHTVVSWIFAVMWRAGWNSTIFGPYFVSGAIYSGTSALVTILALVTWYYGFEDYITMTHIKLIIKMWVTVDFVYMYFTLNEIIVPAYKREGREFSVLYQKFYGDMATVYWFVIIVGAVIPFFVGIWLYNMKEKNKNWFYLIAIITSLLSNIGSWFERYTIVVPTLRSFVVSPIEPLYVYLPIAGEIWITLAQVAFFIFFYWFLNKLIPHIPLWEVELEWEKYGLVKGETPTRKHLNSMGSDLKE